MLDILNTFLSCVNDFLWGYFLIFALLGVHLYLTVVLRVPQRYLLRGIAYSMRRKSTGNSISHYASLATSLADGWTSRWSAGETKKLIGNLIAACTPDVRIDHPFSLELDYNDYAGGLEIIPGILDPKAEATVTLVKPDGTKKQTSLIFDGKKYTYLFDTGAVGRYSMTVTYKSGENSYESTRVFYLSYPPEHNTFANFDKSVVWGFMRGYGSISEDGIPSLENDKNELSTYKRSYAVPLLIGAVCLFVADIAVRKFDTGKKKNRKRA